MLSLKVIHYFLSQYIFVVFVKLNVWYFSDDFAIKLEKTLASILKKDRGTSDEDKDEDRRGSKRKRKEKEGDYSVSLIFFFFSNSVYVF